MFRVIRKLFGQGISECVLVKNMKTMRLVVVVLLGLFSSIAIVQGWRSFKVIFTSFPYEMNKDYIEGKLEISNETGETTINYHMNVIEQIDQLSLSYEISLEASEGNFTTLGKRKVEFCKFLKIRAIEPFLKLIYDDLGKHGTFIKSCPVKKGIYYIHDYRLDEEMLPSYVPETNVVVEILWTIPDNPPIFKGTLHAKIDKSKGFNNLKIFSLG